MVLPQVRVLGEAYTPDDEEDSASGQVRPLVLEFQDKI